MERHGPNLSVQHDYTAMPPARSSVIGRQHPFTGHGRSWMIEAIRAPARTSSGERAMDDSVHKAMARWPDVPAVYGYIGVNHRGDFLLQGHVVTHERTREFIHRNYGLDEHGRAFFQNGPQRAYADLEATPWIYRLMDDGQLRTHTEQPVASLHEAGMTADGDIVLVTEHGPGLLHAQDLDQLTNHLASDSQPLDDALAALAAGADGGVTLTLPAGRVPVDALGDAALPSRFRYTPQPEPDPDDPRSAVSTHRPAWHPAPDAD